MCLQPVIWRDPSSHLGHAARGKLVTKAHRMPFLSPIHFHVAGLSLTQKPRPWGRGSEAPRLRGPGGIQKLSLAKGLYFFSAPMKSLPETGAAQRLAAGRASELEEKEPGGTGRERERERHADRTTATHIERDQESKNQTNKDNNKETQQKYPNKN